VAISHIELRGVLRPLSLSRMGAEDATAAQTAELG
jgi:hypothetical protein